MATKVYALKYSKEICAFSCRSFRLILGCKLTSILLVEHRLLAEPVYVRIAKSLFD